MTDQVLDQPIDEILDTTPLLALIEDHANALVRIDSLKSLIDELQIAINEHIAEQFPLYDVLKMQLTDARNVESETRAKLDYKAKLVDKAVLGQYNNAVTIASVKRVTHFDRDSALAFIRDNRLKCERMGVVKISTNKSDWQKAITNGHQVPDEIAQIEDVLQVRVSENKIKDFATKAD